MSIRKRGDRYQVRVRVGSGQRLERTLPVGATLADARVEPADTAPSSPGTFVSPVQYAQDIGLL